MSERTILINRAPVLTLWASVVAERLGFDHDEALSLGNAVAGLTAQSKGRKVRWGDDYDGMHDPEQLIATLRQAAMKRHRQHVANIHRNYGREIGLVSKRGTVKLRYAPTDSLLKTLLFANVEKRTELHQFLDRLHRRYGIVFGDKEAEQVLAKDEFDKKAFQANLRRLEHRLGSLGLLRRLSDGCAYVINPYPFALCRRPQSSETLFWHGLSDSLAMSPLAHHAWPHRSPTSDRSSSTPHLHSGSADCRLRNDPCGQPKPSCFSL
jgi:hypothetical protein